MSLETFERARRYAPSLISKGQGRDRVAVVALRLITNGWGLESGRSTEVFTHAVEFSREDGRGEGMVIWPDWREPHRSLYVVDDGRTVRPMYVTGWQAETHVEEIYLGTFPLNVGPDGEPIIRPDNGRPVDHSGWLLPAGKAYHVKVTRDIPALAGQPY